MKFQRKNILLHATIPQKKDFLLISILQYIIFLLCPVWIFTIHIALLWQYPSQPCHYQRCEKYDTYDT